MLIFLNSKIDTFLTAYKVCYPSTVAKYTSPNEPFPMTGPSIYLLAITEVVYLWTFLYF
jgi:hypothetical protein